MTELSNPFDAIVSVVLYNTSLDEIAQSIAQALASPMKVHIVLVDNSAEALTLPALDPAHVTVLRSGRNLGYGAGHNLAFDHTRGWADVHFALNSDLNYGPEVLPELVRYLNDHRDVGLVMPCVRYPDGSIQRLCRLLPTPLDIFGRGLFRHAQWTQRRSAIYELSDWNYAEEAQFPFLSGCFMGLRRSVLDQVEGFDERFFLYGEDVDLSRRIHRITRTMFVPSVTVIHEYRSQTAASYRRTWAKFVNLGRYFMKWGFFDRDRDRINRQTLEAIGMIPKHKTGVARQTDRDINAAT